MREDLIERTLKEARYISETGATVRETAKVFHYSKSTVHKDVSERLRFIDKALFLKVKKVLKVNLDERHIRGGQATREKYLKFKKASS
ncbi:MAG: sporulation transcriptional regulator SpoIIID [Clostridia bacterium]|nr:sporulation transcriptional regulator SpoIIID [Clostridia bacterium]